MFIVPLLIGLVALWLIGGFSLSRGFFLFTDSASITANAADSVSKNKTAQTEQKTTSYQAPAAPQNEEISPEIRALYESTHRN